MKLLGFNGFITGCNGKNTIMPENGDAGKKSPVLKNAWGIIFSKHSLQVGRGNLEPSQVTASKHWSLRSVRVRATRVVPVLTDTWCKTVWEHALSTPPNRGYVIFPFFMIFCLSQLALQSCYMKRLGKFLEQLQ